MIEKSFISNSCEKTGELASCIAQAVWKHSGVIALVGDIGTGKTTFVHYFLAKFFEENPVSSPTFSIINEYQDKEGFEIFHLDLYRIESENDLISLDLPFYFDREGIKLVEWADHPLFCGVVDIDLKISFFYETPDSRRLSFEILNEDWIRKINL